MASKFNGRYINDATRFVGEKDLFDGEHIPRIPGGNVTPGHKPMTQAVMYKEKAGERKFTHNQPSPDKPLTGSGHRVPGAKRF